MHFLVKELSLLLHPYLFAAVSVGIATILRLAVDPILRDDHPLLLYYGALAATAWRGGWGPAVFSLVSGYVVADWFFLPPRQDISIFHPEPFHLVGCGTFLGTGLMIAAFSEATKRAKNLAQSSEQLAQKRSKDLQAEMVERLRAETALQGHQQRLRLAMDAARMVSWDWETFNDARILSNNAPEVLGISSRCDSNQFLDLLHPDDLPNHEQSVSEAIRKRGSYISQFRLIRPDNSLVLWVEDRAIVNCDQHGNVIGMSGIIMDVTTRKMAQDEVEKARRELENRVQARTAELASANKELEAFSYSVSHDLRGPIRSVNSYAYILKERWQGKLETMDEEMLSRILESGLRMDEILTDLLSLSHVSRHNLRRELTDLSALAGDIVARLQSTEPHRAMDVSIAPGLIDQADARLLRTALENLLRNAWKFTNRCARGRIEFGARSDKGKRIYFVRDNGAGFDMAHAPELFGAFHRLHSDAEFPGTGIGLAIVQRIIHRHGGQVWAEGAVNQGATFFFTLPTDAGSSREI